MTKTLEKVFQSASIGNKNGTLLASFGSNTLARIYLVDGVPVTARYGGLQGSSALKLCKNLTIKSLKFSANTDLVKSNDLIPSDDGELEPPSTRFSELVSVLGAEKDEGGEFTDDLKEQLIELLSEYLGPMAAMVVNEIPSSTNPSEAIAQIADQIPDAGQADEFFMAASKVLSS